MENDDQNRERGIPHANVYQVSISIEAPVLQTPVRMAPRFRLIGIVSYYVASLLCLAAFFA